MASGMGSLCNAATRRPSRPTKTTKTKTKKPTATVAEEPAAAVAAMTTTTAIALTTTTITATASATFRTSITTKLPLRPLQLQRLVRQLLPGDDEDDDPSILLQEQMCPRTRGFNSPIEGPYWLE